jgi:hypothetical protein
MSERGEIKTFCDLIVWQKAHEMDLRVIELVSADLFCCPNPMAFSLWPLA